MTKREILFKGKRIDNGEWIEGYYCKRKTGHYDNVGFHDEYKDCIIVEFSDGGITWYDVDPSTICRYIGESDKNDQPIWENDIVEGSWWDGGKKYKHIGIVTYLGSSYKVVGVNEFSGYHDELNGSYEVIGNVFDNPELLK